MTSPAWLKQETQNATSGVTTQSQVAESSVGGPLMGPPTSVTASPTLAPPTGGPTTSTLTPVTSPPSPISGPSASVTGPTHAAGQSIPRAPHGTANNPVQEPVRAKFVASPGYVVPAPSFSYSVLPMTNSVSGSSQQSSSTPVLKLAPPVSAAALQPPVPGQSLGNRPSFSYSIVSQTVSSATGQQFQPATAPNQAHLQGGKSNPAPTAASLQPPVPGKSVHPSSNLSGAIAQNIPFGVQVPFSVPRGQVSTSTGFSFGGSSEPAKLETSEKNSSANKGPSEALAPENSTASASSQSTQSSPSMPTSSSIAPAMGLGSSSMVPMAPSFPARPVMPVVAGMPGQPGIPNSTACSTAAIQPVMADSSSLRPMVPSPVPAPSSSVATPVPPNMQQPTYPPYSSLPAMAAPPQAVWLQTPQTGSLQRAPFMPYPGVLPAPYPLPMHGMSLPTVPSPSVQPPGVSPVVGHVGLSSSTTPSSQPGINSSEDLTPPGVDNSKQANDLQKHVEITKNEGAWTAHRTETGAIYYYNSLTGESTYEKPANFKGEPEKVAVQPTPVSWEKLPGTDWTVVTTNDGKTYYYDTKNKVSSWQVPAEIVELRKNQDSDSLKENATQVENASLTPDRGSAPISLSTPAVQTGGRDSVGFRPTGASVSSSALDLIKKKLQDTTTTTTSPGPASSAPIASDLNGSREVEDAVKGPQIKDKVKYASKDGNMSDSSSDSDDAEPGPTKEECITQFKEMLKERGVAPFSKWDKELPKIVFDPRFKAVPGYSARRAIFEQYVRTRVEEERKEKRAAQKAAIDGFKQLLEEASEDIDHRTDYQTFKRKWSNDPRFEALDRKERELLLNGKILPLKKAAEEKIKAAAESFKSMLREKTDITTASRWARVKDSLRNDPRYKSVKHDDRGILFNEYILELKAAEDEAARAAKAKKDDQEKLKEREREMRKRKEREEQEMERVRLKIRRKEAVTSYQALLVETIKDPKASWTESKPKLEKDPQNRATNPDLGQGDAEKLFREHVKELYERCARDYRFLLAEVITGDAAAQVTDDGKTLLNSWSEAKRLLKPDPRYTKMPRKDRESLWLEYAEEITRKQKSSADVKDKPDSEGRNRTSHSDPLRRSPRRSSHGRR